MTDFDTLCLMALTHLPGIGLGAARRLYLEVGDADHLIKQYKDIKQYIPDVSERLQQSLLQLPELIEQMKPELDFAREHDIQCLGFNEEVYPSRMRECDDAPLLLFYKGNINLNRMHVICMVGTRRCTEYGKDICQRFLSDLAKLIPDVLVVSGLAYGIDVNAHQQALENGLDTVGVLAHGLDRLYPSSHRRIANEMVSHGGLLTEFKSGTNPDPYNFVQRNRIVAGISDACIVVESSEKGGSLITADIANSYNREVFACPGRITDKYSTGCNRLIRDNKAVLLEDAESFVNAMGWNIQSTKNKQPIQRELFVNFSPEEAIIVKTLFACDGKQINTIAVESNMAINKVSAVLFELEMKGVVKALTGGMYRLL